MEELKELPENWCVKITAENINFYKTTDKLGFGQNYEYEINGFYGPKRDSKGYKGNFYPEDRTVLTDEDFKRLILKEKKEKYFLCDNAKLETLKQIFNFKTPRSFIENQFFNFNGEVCGKEKGEQVSFSDFLVYYKNKCIKEKIFPVLGYCKDASIEVKIYLTKTQRKLGTTTNKKEIVVFWNRAFYGNLEGVLGLDEYPLFTNKEILSIISSNKEEIDNLIKENTAPKKEKIYLTILETPNPGNNILGASFQVEEISEKVYKSGDIIFDFNNNYKDISHHISKTYEEECLFLDKITTFKKNLSQYKLGTEFNVAHLKNQKCIIESNDFKIDHDLRMIWNYSKDKSLFNDFARCVFYFEKWGEILKSKPEISKIDKKYLNSGCCKTLNPIIINYFKKKFPNYYNSLLKNKTGISWNSNGFWYVIDVNKCKSSVITEEDFLLLLEQQGELKNPYTEDINPCKEVYGTKIHEEFFKINDKKEVLYNPKSELIYEKEQNNLKNNTLEINENELILEIEFFPELEFINITKI